MQRCLSGLRSTIGNRVTGELVRRFKSSSLRQGNKRDSAILRSPFYFSFLAFARFLKIGSNAEFCKLFSFKIVHHVGVHIQRHISS